MILCQDCYKREATTKVGDRLLCRPCFQLFDEGWIEEHRQARSGAQAEA